MTTTAALFAPEEQKSGGCSPDWPAPGQQIVSLDKFWFFLTIVVNSENVWGQF